MSSMSSLASAAGLIPVSWPRCVFACPYFPSDHNVNQCRRTMDKHWAVWSLRECLYLERVRGYLMCVTKNSTFLPLLNVEQWRDVALSRLLCLPLPLASTPFPRHPQWNVIVQRQRACKHQDHDVPALRPGQCHCSCRPCNCQHRRSPTRAR